MCVTGLWGNRLDMGSVAGYVTHIHVDFTRKVGACRLGKLVFGQSASISYRSAPGHAHPVCGIIVVIIKEKS